MAAHPGKHGNNMFNGVYTDRRVLVTGHTGFKGSWLALWLQEMGARVTGVALAPESETSHWDLLGLDLTSHYVDIRDSDAVQGLFRQVQPEIVFHLAAQSLVRPSYREPLDTWSTNVMGTANILEACRNTPGVKAIVVVTTDKVYENQEWAWGYRESDRLGGHDPYSASKAACELVTSSYRKSFFPESGETLLASARAGNVIGGGDWSEDRLIPDLVRSVNKSNPVEIRFPNATRPWQHVLDCLAGYLQLGEGLFAGKREYASAWNFAPESVDNRSVLEVLVKMQQYWPELKWIIRNQDDFHEANLLYLDSTRARKYLHWTPLLTLDTAISMTTEWYRDYQNNFIQSRKQLSSYLDLAREVGLEWAI